MSAKVSTNEDHVRQPPLLVIPAFGAQEGGIFTVTKALVSSLMRSLFSGRLVVFHNRPVDLFKIERRQVEEVPLPFVTALGPTAGMEKTRWKHFFAAMARVEAGPGQWVIVVGSPGMALRNIDHLIPCDVSEAYPPRAVDFYWAEAGGDEGRRKAAPGFWAVRGEHLATVLQHWEQARAMAGADDVTDEVAIWSGVVETLPLRKKRFEAGEVVAPPPSSLDWPAVRAAAFVSLSCWPEAEACQFLQSLYYGVNLGDERGTMLDLLEA